MPTTNLIKILDHFEAASTRLRYPKIHVTWPTELLLKQSGSRAAFPGAITITNGKAYGDPDNIFYGRILTDGSLSFQRNIGAISAAMIENWLRYLPADITTVATSYGRKTCTCMFCGRHLDTNESRHLGYGPVCAEKWSLPWGGEYAASVDKQLLLDLGGSEQQEAQ